MQDRGEGLVTVADVCFELDMFYINVNITAHILYISSQPVIGASSRSYFGFISHNSLYF